MPSGHPGLYLKLCAHRSDRFKPNTILIGGQIHYLPLPPYLHEAGINVALVGAFFTGSAAQAQRAGFITGIAPMSNPVAPMTNPLTPFDAKCAGARSAGNPHAACAVAGTGNGTTETPKRAHRRKRRIRPRSFLRVTEPVLDPTTFITSCLLGVWGGCTASQTPSFFCPLFAQNSVSSCQPPP